jgi:hypothetical protein
MKLEDMTTPVQGPLIWVFLVFSILMLLDAILRRAGWFWYIVILAAPLGAVIYFVAVMLPKLSARTNKTAPSDSASLGRPKTSSGFVYSNIERADHLEAAEQYDEAIPIYEEALERDPNNLRALHGMARCELGLGHPRVAVELLEKVLGVDREHANFGAALDYADALWLAGQRQDTLDLLRGLVDVTGRINHRLALGHYLAEGGDLEAAKTEVARAITAHAALPGDEQARQKHWLDRAQQMIEQWQ